MKLVSERVESKIDVSFIEKLWKEFILKATCKVERNLCFKFLEDLIPNDKE